MQRDGRTVGRGVVSVVSLIAFVATQVIPARAWAHMAAAVEEQRAGAEGVREVAPGEDPGTELEVDAPPLAPKRAEDGARREAAAASVNPPSLLNALGAPAALFASNAVAGAAVSAPATGLPSGVPAISPQTIAAPKGEGTVEGMGESFSAQLSTGIATLSVPLKLPAARGNAQPRLALSYSSAGGAGLGGIGWALGVPYIARQTDRGIPHYGDAPRG